jgi:hypothetical protein
MRAVGKEVSKMPARIRNRIGVGNSDAIEAKRAGFGYERGSQHFSGGNRLADRVLRDIPRHGRA